MSCGDCISPRLPATRGVRFRSAASHQAFFSTSMLCSGRGLCLRLLTSPSQSGDQDAGR